MGFVTVFVAQLVLHFELKSSLQKSVLNAKQVQDVQLMVLVVQELCLFAYMQNRFFLMAMPLNSDEEGVDLRADSDSRIIFQIEPIVSCPFLSIFAMQRASFHKYSASLRQPQDSS